MNTKNTKKSHTTLLLALSALTLGLSLAGCSPSGGLMRQNIEESASVNTVNAEKKYQESRPQAEKVNQGIVQNKAPWVSTQRIESSQGSLPAWINQQAKISQTSPVPVESMGHVLSNILTQASRSSSPIAVMIERDAIASKAGGGSAPPPAGQPTGQPANPPAAGGGDTAVFQSLLSGSTGGGRPPATMKMNSPGVAISYQGTVRGLLDTAASHMDMRWRWEPGSQRVVFYKYVTKEWTLAMLPGTFTSKTGMDSGGGDSSSGAATSSAQYEISTNIWASTKESLNVVMSPDGALSMNESTNTVTMRDTPEAIERADSVVKKVNDTMMQQVSIEVNIYRVLANEGDMRSVNWDGVFKSVGLNVALSAGGALSTTNGLSSMLLDIPNTAQGGLRHFVGSKTMLEALNKVGKASLVTNVSTQTLSNQTVPLRSGRRVAYLKSTSSNLVSNAGSSTSINPSFVDTGLTMSITPQIEDGGRRVLMQMTITLNELNEIRKFKSGTAEAEFPDVSSREFIQRVRIRSGESYVIFGFESMNEFVRNKSPIDSRLWMLGGTSDVSKEKETLVVVVTPVVHSNFTGSRTQAAYQ